MNKTILTLILGIFLISLTTALYSGETVTYDFSNKVDKITSLTYEVINGSNDWFEVSYFQTEVYVTPRLYLSSGQYNINLEINGEITEEIVSSRGGGGTSSRYYIWNCSTWDNCKDGYSNRTCIKQQVNYQTELKEKPDEILKCTIFIPTKPNEEIKEVPYEEVPQETEEYTLTRNQKLKIIIIGLLAIAVITYFLHRKQHSIEGRREESQHGNN